MAITKEAWIKQQLAEIQKSLDSKWEKEQEGIKKDEEYQKASSPLESKIEDEKVKISKANEAIAALKIKLDEVKEKYGKKRGPGKGGGGKSSIKAEAFITAIRNAGGKISKQEAKKVLSVSSEPTIPNWIKKHGESNGITSIKDGTSVYYVLSTMDFPASK